MKTTMHKKQMVIGIVMGLIANSVGVLICVFVFNIMAPNNFTYLETLQSSVTNGTLGSLITLGAILNLVVFFLFLKQNKVMQARGVLLATLIAACCIVISKFG